jgi:hypothetical protein
LRSWHPATPGETRIMTRSNRHLWNGATGMTRRIAATVMTLGIAIATMTSALALEGLDEPPAVAPAAPPQLKEVVVQVKIEKNAQPRDQEQPVRVLKAAPAPRRLARKQAAAAAPAAFGAPMAVNADGQVRQYMQQFRPILRAEYHIVRAICRPTPEQRNVIARAGEQTLREAVKKYVDMMHRPMTAAQRAALDPRTQIREGLAKAVRTKLSPELAAKFEEEIARRDVSRKELAVRNLVARLDRDLVLSPDQRTKIAESLSSHWQDSWCQSLEMFMYDYQFLPPIPDQHVAPFLNDPQKKIWRGTQKVGAFWGGFGMMNGIMADDPLEDDELRQARKEAERNDPNPAPNPPGRMMGGAVLKGAVIEERVEFKVQTKPMMKRAQPAAKAPAKPAAEFKK